MTLAKLCTANLVLSNFLSQSHLTFSVLTRQVFKTFFIKLDRWRKPLAKKLAEMK